MSAYSQEIVVPASRTDTVTFTVGSSTVLDASVTAADVGRAISGVGIPAHAVIGNVVASTSFSIYVHGIPTPATVSGTSITVGAILLFELFDGVTWATMLANTTASPAFPLCPQYLKEGTFNDNLPLLVILPSAATIFLGGHGVTSSSTGIGAACTGIAGIPYNAVGGDSLYAVVTTSTQTVSLLALRQ